ncbi:MAG: hypothetical protein IMZ53_00955 [Thermoplasmata archaeon]|nr:hypothetical protein [Thermoplasmata archaeon]
MTDVADYKPRFSFEITEEQMLRANKLLAQYGLRKAIFGKVLDEVLDLIESHGGIAIGIMMTERIKVKDIIPTMQDVTAATSKKGKDNG